MTPLIRTVMTQEYPASHFVLTERKNLTAVFVFYGIFSSETDRTGKCSSFCGDREGFCVIIAVKKRWKKEKMLYY